MSAGDRYVKIVEWSDEDGFFIGSCPELLFGGCHGTDAKEVFAELCSLIEETIALCAEEGKKLPPPMSRRDFVNAMQRVA
jgi:predicted RNase H-like HicB family nuclease